MFGETVTRVRREPTGTDRYGNPTHSDVTADIDGAAVGDPSFTEPAEVGRESVEADLVLYWPGREIDGRADDDWIVRGNRYESVGPAFWWVNPWRQTTAGTVVKLKAVTG